MNQSMDSGEGEWNQMSIQQETKHDYWYIMGKMKQEQTDLQQEPQKKNNKKNIYMNILTSNPQKSPKNE